MRTPQFPAPYYLRCLLLRIRSVFLFVLKFVGSELNCTLLAFFLKREENKNTPIPALVQLDPGPCVSHCCRFLLCVCRSVAESVAEAVVPLMYSRNTEIQVEVLRLLGNHSAHPHFRRHMRHIQRT